MAITIAWGTKVISVPQADLIAPISGNIYTLDLEAFRLALRALEASEEGMPFDVTHNHNSPVTVGGVTLAQVVELINGYTVTFEDGMYAVDIVGGNNNIADNVNVNQVGVRTNNTAGLVVSGSGVTATDKTDIRDAVWAAALEGSVTATELLRVIVAFAAGKTVITPGAPGEARVVFRDLADTRDRIDADVVGSERTAVALTLG